MEYYKWIMSNQLKSQPHKDEVYVRSSHKTETGSLVFFLVLSLFGNLSNVLTNMEDLIINVLFAKEFAYWPESQSERSPTTTLGNNVQQPWCILLQ